MQENLVSLLPPVYVCSRYLKVIIQAQDILLHLQTYWCIQVTLLLG